MRTNNGSMRLRLVKISMWMCWERKKDFERTFNLERLRIEKNFSLKRYGCWANRRIADNRSEKRGRVVREILWFRMRNAG